MYMASYSKGRLADYAAAWAMLCSHTYIHPHYM